MMFLTVGTLPGPQVVKEDATERFLATRRKDQQRALQHMREDRGLRCGYSLNHILQHACTTFKQRTRSDDSMLLAGSWTSSRRRSSIWRSGECRRCNILGRGCGTAHHNTESWRHMCNPV